jgi:hypothetical protein
LMWNSFFPGLQSLGLLVSFPALGSMPRVVV